VRTIDDDTSEIIVSHNTIDRQDVVSPSIYAHCPTMDDMFDRLFLVYVAKWHNLVFFPYYRTAMVRLLVVMSMLISLLMLIVVIYHVIFSNER
jgi:hypothetical protein